MSNSLCSASILEAAAEILVALPVGRRAEAVREALSFNPAPMLDQSFEIGRLRAALADYWESFTGNSIPIRCLRQVMEPPMKIGIVLQFGLLRLCRDKEETTLAVAELVKLLRHECDFSSHRQSLLFPTENAASAETLSAAKPETVASLAEILETGIQFPTIYADPPWKYDNRASNGAAKNHYPTMSVDEIRREPVGEIASQNAHLHLWTTNGFLSEALDIVSAWGFEYKSCLVWVKPELGMGNYWRVSHEYLLLGVRGSLTFRDRSIRSWIEASRTIHSRKPKIVRSLIERVSPGPYLELFGRSELPHSQWTVHGNQVEKRWF